MDILKQFTKERKNLLPILYSVQDTEGYIKPEAIKAISKFLDLSENDIYSVITSYHHLRLTKSAQHYIQMCHCLACRLSGNEIIKEIFQREIGLMIGHTSEDLKICLEETIFATCSSLSPIVIVDNIVYTRATSLWARDIITKIRGQ